MAEAVALTKAAVVAASSSSAWPTMSDATNLGRFVVDSLTRAHVAAPRHPGAGLESLVKFGSLMLNVASLLPNQEIRGLGESQQGVIQRAIDCIVESARGALVEPLVHASPAVIDLLWFLAKDERQVGQKGLRTDEGAFSPSTVRTHRYIDYDDGVKDVVGGLASAERFYEACFAGYQRLKRMVCAEYWTALDDALPSLTMSMVGWALPLMFDGLRLRRGLEVAAPCGVLVGGQRAPFGLESTAAMLLSDGETTVDRERAARTVQFLLAAAKQGLRENDPDEPGRAHSWDPDEPETEHPRDTVYRLERKLKDDLETCRKNNECKCFVPVKSMRVILDDVADEVERMAHSRGSRLFFQYALAYPCLRPKNLRALRGYDGGLLSVWDCCNYLLRLHAQEHGEVLPFHGLICAVMSGVVGGLMSDTITGPFCVDPSTPVFDDVASINASWPAPSKLPPGCDAVALAAGQRKSGPMHGKQVGATSAVCATIERGVLKAEQPTSAAAETRFESALTMHAVAASMAQLPGVFGSNPSDGILSLKRLYFVALGQSVPAGCTKSLWREVAGGALLATGPLFPFARGAFVHSLQQDWKPIAAVAEALHGRSVTPQALSGKAKSVMLPSQATSFVCKRANQRVTEVTRQIDSLVKAVDGPVFVTRVVQLLRALAATVLTQSDCGALWEALMSHFGHSVTRPKRARSADVTTYC